MMAIRILFFAAAVFASGCGAETPSPSASGPVLAFPTAEGFGAMAKGGRSGAVIYVNNLNDSGPGSLRACTEESGPRTCIFRTGGTITLQTSIKISEPYLTIAGESAPGDGIAVKNSPAQIRPSIEVLSHDVIIRHLRLRPGPHIIEACCSGALGLYTEEAHDIIIDHVSASWGSDETIDSEGATNVTFQWGLVGEPLLDGGPGKRGRARNMLFTKGGNFTVHHTLFAMGKFRNPQLKAADSKSVADVVNNVLYSPVWQYAISLGDEWAHVNANIVGNYKIAGRPELESDDHLVHLFEESGQGFSIYASGNYDEPYRLSDDDPEHLILADDFRKYLVTKPLAAPPVRATTAEAAYDQVLAGAGATKPRRDAVDARLVREVETRQGQLLVNKPENRGGWPELEAGTPYPDQDEDGMSDAWERDQGLDPDDADDGNQDRNGDGWTNLEEFLHTLAGDLERGNRLP